jgi:rubrerythrin
METKLRQFEQVKDVLEYGKLLHQEIKALAERMEDVEQSARLKLLLEYLKRHEDELSRALARFSEQTKQRILDIWLPYPPDPKILEKLRAITIHPNMSVEEVAKIVLTFEDALIELYRESLNEIDDSEVQEMLANLVQLEDAEKRRFAMNLARFQEI